VISLDLVSFVGAIPIYFGMPRMAVLEILGPPGFTGENSAGQTCDSWGPDLELCLGYRPENAVDHIGLRPGVFETRFQGEVIWPANSGPSAQDPNVILLRFEPQPLEYVGFLIFPTLGITTAGFHDDDPGQRSIVLYPAGRWDAFLKKARQPDLSKYQVVRADLNASGV
jgi:hypothetical protein